MSTDEESVRRALFRVIEESTERIERAQAVDVILRELGVIDPTVDDVARIMRWADGYNSVAIDAVVAAGWRAVTTSHSNQPSEK